MSWRTQPLTTEPTWTELRGQRRIAWLDRRRGVYVCVGQCESCGSIAVYARKSVVWPGTLDSGQRDSERLTEWRVAWKGWSISPSLRLLCPRCSADPRADALAVLRSPVIKRDTREARARFRSEPLYGLARFAGWMRRLR